MEICASATAGSDLKMANDGTITIPRLNIWGRLYLIAPNPSIGLPHHLSFILEIFNLILFLLIFKSWAVVCRHGLCQHTKEKKPGNSSEAFAGSGWESGQGIPLDVGAHSY